MIGTSVAGVRITEELASGTWNVYRGHAADGARVIVTVVAPPPPATTLTELALPFAGIPELRAVVPIADAHHDALAIVETEPRGYRIGDLRWPLPIDEVITVGLDLARLLERMHAAGTIHGALRPQTVWIDNIDGRCTLTGTTPRPERAGLHCLASASTGSITPFFVDPFLPDVLARGEPASVSSDVAQLGMLIHRMATHRSPFAGGPGEPIAQQLVRALGGDIPPWPAGDARSRAVEELARAAFDPARADARALAPLLAGLEAA